MNKIFLLPGLGADCRMYGKIRLDNYEAVNADWIEPAETDTLTTYAQKLISHYNITPGTIVLGTSLGGMVAVEIAKLVKLQKLILISTIKTVDEAPGYYAFSRILPLYKLIAPKSLSKLGFLIKPMFGKWDNKGGSLFNTMLKESSPVFVKWALGAVLNWKNKTIVANTFHIAGTADRIFPFKNLNNVILVKGGSHMMIGYKADEINILLKMILNNEIASIVLPS